MAVGDKKAGATTLTADQIFDIRPPVGEEWTIHNLYYGSSSYNATVTIDLIIQDGATQVYFDRDTSQGARLGLYLNLTNNHYLRLKNGTASNTFNVSYDGVQTK